MMIPIRARALESIRPTRAIIDLSAIGHNLRELRKIAGDSKIFGVIKADAYGHGAVEVARQLVREGIDGLCVALPEEGIELRQAGLRVPVLVLGGTYLWGAAELIAHHLVPVVHDLEQIAQLSEVSAGKKIKVHLKIDTGMSRLGVSCDQLPSLLWQLRRFPSVQIEGVMSHFSSAESDPLATALQIERFEGALGQIRRAGITPSLVHMSNSAGLFNYPVAHFSAVRPGIALYGVSPTGNVGEALLPVMTVLTEVVHLKTLEVGDCVSYGGTFKAARKTRLAVLPMGYADGLSPRLSNRGEVLIRGRRAKIVGAVCMDMCMADVTDIPDVQRGDEVVLLGSQGEERISAQELAAIHGSVPHEVLTSISRRVPRFYYR